MMNKKDFEFNLNLLINASIRKGKQLQLQTILKQPNDEEIKEIDEDINEFKEELYKLCKFI